MYKYYGSGTGDRMLACSLSSPASGRCCICNSVCLPHARFYRWGILWPPSWICDTKSQIWLHQLMCIYFMNN